MENLKKILELKKESNRKSKTEKFNNRNHQLT